MPERCGCRGLTLQRKAEIIETWIRRDTPGVDGEGASLFFTPRETSHHPNQVYHMLTGAVNPNIYPVDFLRGI